ncbi:uncharacterized protein KGF55_003178 [Candida pseudojiufengensis]|uniref:uncharacterized protein n=1 Tax=Candida pseudojiufengensis TaxID=497109 RepID=UPI002224A42B|nr:uncharacterized protein KGF55_003178 [Candida pseudojiufengensis]KAI5962102.1 hypothetical protein KGF55_003178 [Candida pseudojiufengensis]
MGKITRVRTGCWTCKKRHRKCDETKPACNNCKSTGRECEGYDIRLSFDFFHEGQSSRKRRKLDAKKQQIEPQTPAVSSPNSIQSLLNDQDADINNKTPSPATASTNLNQFSSALFEDLQSLLSSSASFNKSNLPTNMEELTPTNPAELFNFDFQIIDFIDKSQIFDENHKFLLNNMDPKHNDMITASDTSTLFEMSHQEENMMLKHFFNKLLPLLDGHPKSPWPDLALKYCDFNIARSCFISLACIHMYESRAGGNELYQKGVAHINNTMNHLIRYIRENSGKINNENDENASKKYISYFVILVLMNVHILFAVLEKGKSSIAREFFKIFAGICKDQKFYDDILMTSDKRRSLAVVLSWYDTVSAVVSPDCRLPYCLPHWYGTANDTISSSKMMGCPGEVFAAMSEVCILRNKKYNNQLTAEDATMSYDRVKYTLMNYRDYVSAYDQDSKEIYINRMKCGLCWSLAVWVTLNRVVEPVNFIESNQKLSDEFIATYNELDPKSPIVTQMVWPLYAIGCECKSETEKTNLIRFMDNLYENTKMGTTVSMKEIVLKVWELNISQEEYLTEWLGPKGIDYLPL